MNSEKLIINELRPYCVPCMWSLFLLVSHITITCSIRLLYCRSGNFRIRNVTAFNFRRMAKWQKLNAWVRNFCTFNFRRLSNWRKNFNAENFPIYGISFLTMCCVCTTCRWSNELSCLKNPRTVQQRGGHTLRCSWPRPALSRAQSTKVWNLRVGHSPHSERLHKNS